MLPRGTPVVTSDGATVGKVYKVQHHERERIFDGLVVDGDDGRRFVDAPEVGILTRHKVDLLIDRATFAELPVVDGPLTVRRLRKRLPGQ